VEGNLGGAASIDTAEAIAVVSSSSLRYGRYPERNKSKKKQMPKHKEGDISNEVWKGTF
jgi:hypothetical protein